MTIESINNVFYYDFGILPYSFGMRFCSFKRNQTTPQDIADLPGFYLHPTFVPDDKEIFAVKGTKEQYDQFYIHAIELYATKIGCDMYGMNFMDRKINTLRSIMMGRIRNKFVPWYKVSKQCHEPEPAIQ